MCLFQCSNDILSMNRSERVFIPTIVCCIVSPAAMNLRYARHLRKDDKPHESSSKEDLLVLILKHFAVYWDIGSLLLDQL